MILSSEVTMKKEFRSHEQILRRGRAASCLHRDGLLDFFFVAGMGRRQFFHLQDVHAEVADFTQRQPAELRDRLADSAKNIVDGEKRVSSADCLEQVP